MTPAISSPMTSDRPLGFTDRSWLDRYGHPHSESMRVTERFQRLDVGRMEIEISIDDPLTYTRRIAFTQSLRLLPEFSKTFR